MKDAVTVTTLTQLRTVINDGMPHIIATDEAKHMLGRIAIQHNRPYSPFSSAVTALGGLIGSLFGRDFASTPGGRQDITLMAMNQAQIKDARLTPADAEQLITTINNKYITSAIDAGYDLQLPDYSSKFQPGTQAAKPYERYLHKDDSDK